MKKICILLMPAAFAMQCAPPRIEVTPEQTECVPTTLTVQPDDGSLFLTWDTPCADNVRLSGYNIYISTKPLFDKYGRRNLPGKIRSINSEPYPGDTDPEDRLETMPVRDLNNGVEYYVSVRAVFADRSQSLSSNEVRVICRPEGEFELAYRYADLNDGFSFARNEVVR
ncbi:MAG: hypothetical protein JSV44_12470, partial [Candidatus Zixiibacteriota bacterium]